jgi:hypothetical protein
MTLLTACQHGRPFRRGHARIKSGRTDYGEKSGGKVLLAGLPGVGKSPGDAGSISREKNGGVRSSLAARFPAEERRYKSFGGVDDDLELLIDPEVFLLIEPGQSTLPRPHHRIPISINNLHRTHLQENDYGRLNAG